MTEKSIYIRAGPKARNCIHIKGRTSCPLNCRYIMADPNNRVLPEQDEIVPTPDSDVTEQNSDISGVQNNPGQDVLDCAGNEVKTQALGNGDKRESQTQIKATSLNNISGDDNNETQSGIGLLPSVQLFIDMKNLPGYVPESCREVVGESNIPTQPVPIIEQDLPPRPTTDSSTDYPCERYRSIATGTINIVNKIYNNGTVIVVVMVVLLGYWLTFQSSPVGPPYEHSDFQKDLNNISVTYDIKNETMLLIQIGIETTFKNKDTLSMVFLYNDEKPNNMNETRVKEFVNEVAAASAKYLRNEMGTVNPIVVENSDLNVESVGELINKYQGDLEDKGVLIVQDLEDIPFNLAMAFHYYCDEFNPLVNNTAIFFTLNLAKCSRKDGTTEHEVVESCMMEKWSRLAKEKLSPLLTRVVSVVVDLADAVDLLR